MRTSLHRYLALRRTCCHIGTLKETPIPDSSLLTSGPSQRAHIWWHALMPSSQRSSVALDFPSSSVAPGHVLCTGTTPVLSCLGSLDTRAISTCWPSFYGGSIVRRLGIAASTCLSFPFPFRSLKTALFGSCWALGVPTLCMDTSFPPIPHFQIPKTRKTSLHPPITFTSAHAPPRSSAAYSSNELVASMFGTSRRREPFSSRKPGDFIPEVPARNQKYIGNYTLVAFPTSRPSSTAVTCLPSEQKRSPTYSARPGGAVPPTTRHTSRSYSIESSLAVLNGT